jgi:hypothetical protein
MKKRWTSAPLVDLRRLDAGSVKEEDVAALQYGHAPLIHRRIGWHPRHAPRAVRQAARSMARAR